MIDCKPSSTPSAVYFKLPKRNFTKNEVEKSKICIAPCTSAVGCLMYTIVCIRPDIASGSGSCFAIHFQSKMGTLASSIVDFSVLEGDMRHMLMLWRFATRSCWFRRCRFCKLSTKPENPLLDMSS